MQARAGRSSPPVASVGKPAEGRKYQGVVPPKRDSAGTPDQLRLVKRTRPTLGFSVTNGRGVELFELKFQMLIHQHQRLQRTTQIAVAHRDNPVYQRLSFLIHDFHLLSRFDYPGLIKAKFSRYRFESATIMASIFGTFAFDSSPTSYSAPTIVYLVRFGSALGSKMTIRRTGQRRRGRQEPFLAMKRHLADILNDNERDDRVKTAIMEGVSTRLNLVFLAT
jgi:hypothetical protein